jgi:hypothetical protein
MSAHQLDEIMLGRIRIATQKSPFLNLCLVAIHSIVDQERVPSLTPHELWAVKCPGISKITHVTLCLSALLNAAVWSLARAGSLSGFAEKLQALGDCVVCRMFELPGLSGADVHIVLTVMGAVARILCLRHWFLGGSRRRHLALRMCRGWNPVFAALVCRRTAVSAESEMDSLLAFLALQVN